MGCSPTQIVNIHMPINEITELVIKDKCGNIFCDLQYSYSLDGVCWSCYMSADELTLATLNTISDYFVRVKLRGEIGGIFINDEETFDYSTSLDAVFELADNNGDGSSGYSPLDGVDSAVGLQEQLSDIVTNMIGLPIYYFRVSGVADAADLTFKEYALKSVTDVKQLKLVVGDGQMPSSKPEFTEFGLDWQTDWETEISKSSFATAFGINAQPNEGDLVYIPMMKRMWRVNSAYDERNGALMWQSTTFKVYLVKYQIDSSLDLNGQESFIDNIITNKYEDLFGTEEGLDSGVNSTDVTRSRPSNLVAVFKSDATRKEATCSTINFQSTKLYHKSTLITDNCYKFDIASTQPIQIVYQRGFCGDAMSMSFIINSQNTIYDCNLIEIGSFKLIYKNDGVKSVISLNSNSNLKVELDNNKYYLVTLRFSQDMNTTDMSAIEYKYPDNIPLYKLSSHHYFFDVDNRQEVVSRCNSEMNIETMSEVHINGFPGTITNFKLFDVYNDRMSELLQQYPTHQHLQINDTARPFVGLTGATAK